VHELFTPVVEPLAVKKQPASSLSHSSQFQEQEQEPGTSETLIPEVLPVRRAISVRSTTMTETEEHNDTIQSQQSQSQSLSFPKRDEMMAVSKKLFGCTKIEEEDRLQLDVSDSCHLSSVRFASHDSFAVYLLYVHHIFV
jgi:hypothetical protein